MTKTLLILRAEGCYVHIGGFMDLLAAIQVRLILRGHHRGRTQDPTCGVGPGFSSMGRHGNPGSAFFRGVNGYGSLTDDHPIRRTEAEGLRVVHLLDLRGRTTNSPGIVAWATQL